MDEKKKLLYMDDDPHILHMVGDFFSGKGYSVLLAEDGQAGLEIFHDQKPDIVLVDLNMPRVDGFEVLQKVRQESPDTPVIVISGEGEMADVIQALRFGAWNYHPKPIENFTIIQHPQAVEYDFHPALFDSALLVDLLLHEFEFPFSPSK
jgi:DNA-binding response OmpR family regulator